MPAIQMARLRQQSAALVELFDNPKAFIRALNDLFELYSDRVHRAGQAGEPPPLLQAYHVPFPLLRQVVLDLSPNASEDADRTLALCDILWAESFLEPRLLAISMLGKAPLKRMTSILESIQRWAQSTTEERLLNALAEQGLSRVSQENPAQLLEQTRRWLEAEELSLKRLGLQSLLQLIANPDFENLPALLHLLTPYVRIAPLPLRPDVLNLISALAHRSPRETAYFLRQNLEAPENPDAALLIRQSLRHFPDENQASLRAALRQIK